MGWWAIILLKIKRLIQLKLNETHDPSNWSDFKWEFQVLVKYKILISVIQKLGIASLNLQVRLPSLSISVYYLHTDWKIFRYLGSFRKTFCQKKVEICVMTEWNYYKSFWISLMVDTYVTRRQCLHWENSLNQPCEPIFCYW